VTGTKALARCSTATRRQTMAACLNGGEMATVFLCSILSFPSLLKRFPRTYQCSYLMCISLARALARSRARAPSLSFCPSLCTRDCHYDPFASCFFAAKSNGCSMHHARSCVPAISGLTGCFPPSFRFVKTVINHS
jgi:hypothetical protein